MTKISSFAARQLDVGGVDKVAEFPVNEIVHPHIVRSCAHPETEFIMTHLAAKPDTVKPVREYDRSHTVFFSIAVEHHVGILAVGRRLQQAADQDAK